MKKIVMAVAVMMVAMVAEAGPYECKQECNSSANQCIRNCWSSYAPGETYPFCAGTKGQDCNRATECTISCQGAMYRCMDRCLDTKPDKKK